MCLAKSLVPADPLKLNATAGLVKRFALVDPVNSLAPTAEPGNCALENMDMDAILMPNLMVPLPCPRSIKFDSRIPRL